MLLVLAAKAGLVGIPLGFIVVSWFFKYAYILFDHTARGFDEPPTLDIHMLNPVDEQRPLAQVLILGLIGAGVKSVHDAFGVPAGYGLGLLAALSLPASVAVLGLERNVLKALYPVAIWKMVHGLGASYLLVLAVIVAYGLVITWLVRHGLWLSIDLILVMFAILSIYSVLGGALHDRRHELGLETWASPERTAELREKQEQRQSDHIVSQAYGLMRVGSHQEAWSVLQKWLSFRGNAVEDYRWLCGRVLSWTDPRYISRLTQQHVDRLLALKRNGEALDVVAQRLGSDPGFRPSSARATLSLARLAARGGGAPRLARTLLSDFATRFPGDAHLAAAAALARDLEA